LKSKRKALDAVGAANQGKVTPGKSRDDLSAKKLKVSRLSMVQCHVSPRGLVINAGRAFA